MAVALLLRIWVRSGWRLALARPAAPAAARPRGPPPITQACPPPPFPLPHRPTPMISGCSWPRVWCCATRGGRLTRSARSSRPATWRPRRAGRWWTRSSTSHGDPLFVRRRSALCGESAAGWAAPRTQYGSDACKQRVCQVGSRLRPPAVFGKQFYSSTPPNSHTRTCASAPDTNAAGLVITPPSPPVNHSATPYRHRHAYSSETWLEYDISFSLCD